MGENRSRSFVSAQMVADRAGVSRSAVSRTFTSGASVSDTTRQKVLSAATALGYHVNHLARGLIQDRNGKLIAANEQNYRVVITREAAGDANLVLRRLAGIIPMTAEELERAIRIPTKLVEEESTATTHGKAAWAEARMVPMRYGWDGLAATATARQTLLPV